MQKEKQDFVVTILISSLFIMMFSFIVFLLVFNYIRQKRKLLIDKKIRDAHFQQALLEAQLEMQEHTLNGVSQEIHDNVGQILSLIKLNLNILSMDEANNAIYKTLKELVGSAISELRELGAGYHTDRMVDEGLLFGIRHQLQMLEKTGRFKTEFYSDIDNLLLEKSTTIFLYRMIQEALNNVVKHSDAKTIRVNVYRKEENIHIILQDDGKGFEMGSEDFKPGIGLRSIQQRAAMINADASIVSKPGSGTTIIFVFKYKGNDTNRIGG
jgi:signal transduction histidine kinase